jgi:transposase InsO family protein
MRSYRKYENQFKLDAVNLLENSDKTAKEVADDLGVSARGNYGSPRIYNELRKENIKCSEKRVSRLMRENCLRAKSKRKFRITTNSNHSYPVAENLLNRDFRFDSPDLCWVSDISYIWTLEGWLYLCVVLDLFSRKVVGWSMSKSLSSKLAVESLEMAFRARSPKKGLIFHSDRGVQYASKEFRKKLKQFNMVQSMSREGDCWDNACAESFFASLKKEEVFGKVYRSRFEARQSIFEYIAVYYNIQADLWSA